MKLRDIIDQTNVLIDDKLPDNEIVGWVNDALSQIGEAVDAVFPEMDSASLDGVPVIPTKWQRLLIIVFAAARAKEQDSSQFEYQDLYAQFNSNLMSFVAKYEVPNDYKMLEAGQVLSLPNATSYTTVSGDTLNAIAQANTTTVQAILDANTTNTIYTVSDSYSSSLDQEPSIPWMNQW